MATSGRLQSKVDRFKKKLAEKGSSLAADKKRLLTKKLKRFQRARRTALALEKRAAALKGGKGAARPEGEKPEKPSGEPRSEEKAAAEKPAAAGPEAGTSAS